MPFRHFSPVASIFALIAAGIMSLIPSSKRKKQNPAPAPRPAAPRPAPSITKIQSVVQAHKDCTAEIIDIFVSGHSKVAIFSRLAPGDKVDIAVSDGQLKVYADGALMAAATLPDSSLLPRAINESATIHAYLGGRDLTAASPAADFASIIIFYALPGVPPTKVNLA